MLQHLFACSYTKCELVKNCVKMIQTSSQIQYLRQFVHVLPFSAIKLVYLVFLLVRMQKVNLRKIVHKLFKEDFKFNIKGYIWTFYHSKLWNRCIQSQPIFACSYAKCELMKNSAQMIQIRSQILHLSLFIYVLPFKALT